MAGLLSELYKEYGHSIGVRKIFHVTMLSELYKEYGPSIGVRKIFHITMTEKMGVVEMQY
jgi:hypothetical protein